MNIAGQRSEPNGLTEFEKHEDLRPRSEESFNEVADNLKKGVLPGGLGQGVNAGTMLQNMESGYDRAAQLLYKITAIRPDKRRIFVHNLNNGEDAARSRTKMGVSNKEKQILIDPMVISKGTEAVAEILLHEFLHSYAGLSEGTTHAFVESYFPGGVQNAEAQGQKESVESVWKIAELFNKDRNKGLDYLARLEREEAFDSIYSLVEEFYMYEHGFNHRHVKRVRKAKNPVAKGEKIRRKGRTYNEVAEEADQLFRRAFPELVYKGDGKVDGRLGVERPEDQVNFPVDKGTDEVRSRVVGAVPEMARPSNVVEATRGEIRHAEAANTDQYSAAWRDDERKKARMAA